MKQTRNPAARALEFSACKCVKCVCFSFEHTTARLAPSKLSRQHVSNVHLMSLIFMHRAVRQCNFGVIISPRYILAAACPAECSARPGHCAAWLTNCLPIWNLSFEEFFVGGIRGEFASYCRSAADTGEPIGYGYHPTTLTIVYPDQHVASPIRSARVGEQIRF